MIVEGMIVARAGAEARGRACRAQIRLWRGRRSLRLGDQGSGLGVAAGGGGRLREVATVGGAGCWRGGAVVAKLGE